ncbi:MAG: polyprenyl synthetase family protein [Candidatus Thermoplasmatota archaeon]
MMKEVIKSDETMLEKVAKYTIDAGGKRLRPTIAIAAFRAVNGKNIKKILPIATAIELIHTATLIHDDINDSSFLRRGRKTAYRKFGLPVAIVSGDALFAKAFGLCSGYEKEIIDIAAKACTELAEGEIMQLTTTVENISEERYFEIIRKKTGSLMSAGTKIASILAGAEKKVVNCLGDYGLNLGIAFQIADDILDIVGGKIIGKNIGKDIENGKITLPTIYALAKAKERERLKLLIIERKAREVLEIVRKSGGLDYAKEKAKFYSKNAKNALSELPETKHKKELIKIADYVVERRE